MAMSSLTMELKVAVTKLNKYNYKATIMADQIGTYLHIAKCTVCNCSIAHYMAERMQKEKHLTDTYIHSPDLGLVLDILWHANLPHVHI